MSWIDAHCHPDSLADPEAALAEAEAAGVGHWILPGTEPSQWHQAGQRFSSDDRIRFAFGHHPWFLPETAPDLSALRNQLTQSSKVVALGEIGLDFFPADAARAQPAHQQDWFEAQLALAAEWKLPVIVHAVRSHDRILAALKRYPEVRGMVHAFLGPYEQARAYLDKGWYLSAGSLIFKSPKTLDAFARMPRDRLILETDAPDMRPVQAQQPNPLLDLLLVAERVAQVRGESLEVLRQQTRANVLDLFQKF